MNIESKYYTTAQIANMSRMSLSAIKERIRRLEIFPDYMHGKARYFNQEKTQCIMARFKYHKPTHWEIYESKMNYEN